MSIRSPGEALLIERFVPGAEVSLEALLHDGDLQVLALFDKPDPLDGPYFEETIYVTPSRLGGPEQNPPPTDEPDKPTLCALSGLCVRSQAASKANGLHTALPRRRETRIWASTLLQTES